VNQPAEPQFGWAKTLAFSAILIGLFLGMAEVGVRVWAYALRDDAERFDTATETFVLVPGEHRSGPVTARINADGFAGPDLKAASPELFRIVAVGDSCTYGDGNAVHTYPAMMQRLLDQRVRPGIEYEVVNAGISGLNSGLALKRLKTKVVPLAPDVVTIYVGWNDLMKFDPRGQTGSSAASAIARALDNLWLVKGLRKLIFFYVRPRLSSPATGPESRTGAFADFEPEIYIDNLREMIRTVREIDSRPVLFTLPTVVRADMSAEQLDAAGVVFPYFASAFGVGDFLDLVASYNASIARVAREFDVPLIDIASEIARVDDPTEYLFDTMHSRPKGMQLIAQRAVGDLDRLGLLEPDGDARGF